MPKGIMGPLHRNSSKMEGEDHKKIQRSRVKFYGTILSRRQIQKLLLSQGSLGPKGEFWVTQPKMVLLTYLSKRLPKGWLGQGPSISCSKPKRYITPTSYTSFFHSFTQNKNHEFACLLAYRYFAPLHRFSSKMEGEDHKKIQRSRDNFCSTILPFVKYRIYFCLRGLKDKKVSFA